EEDRGVVANQVPVAFVGVKTQSKATDVTLGVGRSALTGHGGESGKHLGLLADLGEDRGLGVPRDVLSDGEGAKGAGALGVHTPLGDDLTVEVGELFEEPQV